MLFVCRKERQRKEGNVDDDHFCLGMEKRFAFLAIMMNEDE